MASELFSNRFAPSGRAEKNQIVDQYGEPFRNGTNGTATSRFAQQFNIGPESGFTVPHILTFSSILGSAFRNYYHGQYDEATRFSREDALAMRNDAYVMSLVDERKRRVITLESHIGVDNPRDAWEKAVKGGMTQLWRSIPDKTNLDDAGMEALWFGRAGSQFDYIQKTIKLPAMPRSTSGGGLPTISMAAGQDQTENRSALVMRGHMPTEGDKIDFDFDGNPYVLVTPMAASRAFQQGGDVRQFDGTTWQRWTPDNDIVPKIKAKHADVGYTTVGGRALYLKGNWRTRWRIHKHMVLDTSFFQPWKAGAIHGVGIRSVIFWYWWLRQEFLSNVTDWCARTGLGIKLWYFESGNKQSEDAVRQAAVDQTDRVNIMVPYTPGIDRPALDVVETNGTGSDMLLRIVKHIEDYLERYIVGQSMSGGSDDMSAGFGDKGRSDYAKNTQYQITKYDAAKFADTNTNDILKVILRWTYPEFADMPIRLVYDVDDPDVGKWIEGAKAFIDMGGKIVADEARSRLGLSAPREGDETVGGMEALQAAQATSGHVKPPGGLAPDAPDSANGQAAQAPPSEPQAKDHYQLVLSPPAPPPPPVTVVINERDHVPPTVIVQPAPSAPIVLPEPIVRHDERPNRMAANRALDRVLADEAEAEIAAAKERFVTEEAVLRASTEAAIEADRSERAADRLRMEKFIQEIPDMVGKFVPEQQDLERFARSMPAPVIKVEVPKQDNSELKELLAGLVAAIKAAQPEPIDYKELAKAIRGEGRKVTIKGPGGKEFTAEVK